MEIDYVYIHIYLCIYIYIYAYTYTSILRFEIMETDRVGDHGTYWKSLDLGSAESTATATATATTTATTTTTNNNDNYIYNIVYIFGPSLRATFLFHSIRGSFGFPRQAVRKQRLPYGKQTN